MTVDQILNDGKLYDFLLTGCLLQYTVEMLFAGFMGSHILLKEYVTKHSDMTLKKGRLPFLFVFFELIISTICSVILGATTYDTNFTFYTFLLSILYICALMKFWLPAKKTNEA